MHFNRLHPTFTAALLLLTAATRLINLHTLPPGLARDEALNADIAEAILNGRHALFFREGYGHEPLYHYLGALFQALIGDNWLAIRLPSAFASIVLGALIYRWIKQLLNEQMAWLAVGIHALLWWGIIFGRVGLRPILYPILLVAAVLIWEKRPILSGILIGLCVYTYTAGQIAPLIPIGMMIWQFRGATSFRKISPLVAVIVALPLFIVLQREPALTDRIGQLSGVLDAVRAGDFRPLFDNIVQTLGMLGVTGSPLSSYGLPDAPVFGVVAAVFAYVGLLIVVVRSYKQNAYRLILIWLIVALLPTILAEDAPSLIRSIGALPVVILLPCVAADWLQGATFGFKVAPFPALRARKVAPRNQRCYLVWLCAAVLIIPTAYRSLDQGREWAKRPDIRKKYQSIWVDIEQDLSDSFNNGTQIVVADAWYEPVKADSLRRNGNVWRPVRWVQKGRAVVVPEKGGVLMIPEFAPVDVRLFEAAGIDPQPDYRSENTPSYASHTLVDRDFDGQIGALNGLTLLDFTVLDDGILTIWRVEDALAWDVSLFVHVLQNGEIMTQHDDFDVGRETLLRGDVVYQLHPLDWSSVPSGEYDLNVGARHTTTGARLLTPLGDDVIGLGTYEK